MPKRRVVDHVQDGEVLLVDKQAVLPDKVLELTHNQAEKLRPKAPRTQAQVENTKRLVELNRKRAQEWKSRLAAPPASATPPPEERDDSKVEVRVKAKRTYERKKPVWNTQELDAPPAPPVRQAPPPPPARPARPSSKQPQYYPSSDEDDDEDDEEEDVPQPLPPVKKAPAKRRLVKSGKRVAVSDTSESESTDTDVEMARVQKYVKKTTARMDAVKAIDERLKQVSNKYVAAGLSVF